MKPYQTLVFLIIVLIILGLISWSFPDDGIKISDNITLHFNSLNDIFHFKKKQYADISDIINNTDIKDSLPDTLSVDAKKDSVQTPDSTKNIAQVKDTTLKEIAVATGKIRNIEFPENKSNLLTDFFKKLQNARNSGKVLRIMHYGDSQIEGDRITSYLRYKLQSQFGGSGLGLLPAKQAYNYSVSMKQEASENWNRYAIIDKTKNNIDHKRYGAMSIFCKFTDATEESNDSTVHESWIKFIKSKATYQTNRKFVKCRMFYGYNNSPVLAEVYQNENLISVSSLSSGKQLNEISWDLKNEYDDLTIKFAGKDSPEIYGIALDDKSGIAVDNLAMRGSSGLDFTRTDFDLMKDMYDKLNVGMVILEFGINVVTGNANDYKYYENWYYNQLQTIKRINPDIAVIVIGVSDMSKKVDGEYESYPNIEQIRDAQRNAAFRAGCAFWDLYEAMGGHNSMPSWVMAKPSLAAKDFTHFSYDGAKKVAEMFYNSFIVEYNKYVKDKK